MAERVDSTLFKGLQILEKLASSPEPLGITDLSTQLALNKSNVHRLVKTLCKMNYVAQEPDRSYRASLKLWRLGQDVMNHRRIANMCHAAMEGLRKISGETIHLSVLDGIRTLYIDQIDGDQSVRAFTERGGTAPLHCVATGKVLLAYSYDKLRDAVIQSLPAHTARTITSVAALDKEMATIRKLGYAVNAGEHHADVGGIAAPVFAKDGTVVAAIGISIPLQRFSKQRLKELSPAVVEAARSVSTLVSASES